MLPLSPTRIFECKLQLQSLVLHTGRHDILLYFGCPIKSEIGGGKSSHLIKWSRTNYLVDIVFTLSLVLLHV